MKRFLMVLAVVAATGVTYVATAPGSLQARGPSAKQFKALKKQVAALSANVKVLQSEVRSQSATISTQASTITALHDSLSALQTDESGVKAVANNDHAFISNCLIAGGVAGISEFGDAAGQTEGYVYQPSGGGSPFLTTALDFDSSSTPSGFFQAVAPSCVVSGTSHGGAALTEHRVSIHPATHR